MDGEVWGADKGWGAPLGGFDAVVGLNVAVDFRIASVRVECGLGMSEVPSRTRNPISFQSVFVSCRPNFAISKFTYGIDWRWWKRHTDRLSREISRKYIYMKEFIQQNSHTAMSDIVV